MANFFAHLGRVAPLRWLILICAHLSRLLLIPMVGIKQLVAPQLYSVVLGGPRYKHVGVRLSDRTMRYVATRSSVNLLCGPI